MMSPKNELQSLCDWLNIDRPEFPWCAVSAFSPYWRERKLIRPVGRQRTTAHCDCDFDHEEEVFYPHGDPVILCSHTGCWRKVDKEELRFWSFDGNAMANILGEQFLCHGSPSELLGGRLWSLGMTAHQIGGITRDIYFALRMSADADSVYERLPKDGTQAVLISGSTDFRHSEHFKTDNVFRLSDVLDFTGSNLTLNLSALESRLGGIPKETEKKASSRDHGKYVIALHKALYEHLKSAHYFYVRGAGLQGERYPQLTLRLMANQLGCAPTTIRSILLKKDDTSRIEYKEIAQRWKAGQTREGIIKFGDSYFCSQRGYDER